MTTSNPKKAAEFRARFLDWAEPRGLEVPTDTYTLSEWIGRYSDETSDYDGAEDYLLRECYDV